ncbi:hypothetical protein GF406_00005, partial [candidate division KSB1 bacterium]|nr:hypothetical protein [candidate division KSB1 bacterium]
MMQILRFIYKTRSIDTVNDHFKEKKKMMKRMIALLLVGSFLVFGMYCAGMSNKQKGAAVGGASGAVIGG